MEPILVFNKGRLIILYFRNNHELIRIVDRKYYPYFYVENQNGEYKTIEGKNAKKIIVQHPRLVKNKREEYKREGKRTYEADIIYTLRYTIDKFDALAESNYVWKDTTIRYCFIDIEARDSLDYKYTPQPLMSITLYDNYTRTFYTLALNNHNEVRSNKRNWIVFIFDNEKQLIENTINLIRKLDPDLILGWNVTYDINYLINRAVKFDINVNKLAREEGVILKDKEVKCVFGRAIVDYKQLFAELYKLDSYALENVGTQVGLNVKKVKKSRISDMCLNELINYNKTDVEILTEIEAKFKVLRFWDEVRRIIGLPWNVFYTDTGISYKRMIDTYLLRLAKKRGIVLPTSSNIVENQTYKGGRVLEPSTGIFENVVVFDVKSTYPNIIRTYNISFETLSDDGSILSPLKHKFKKSPRGLLPELADQLINIRSYYKKKMKETDDPIEKQVYDMRQQAIKIILNSAYGVFGCPYFRLFKKEVAESITAYARELLRYVIEKATQFGYKVIYGDTDSIFVMFDKSMNKEQIYEKANELLNKLNESLSEFARKWNVDKHYHELELKTIFKRLMFYGDKKAYVGYHVWNDGEWCEGIIKKGGIGVKSDSAKITRIVYDNMFRMLLVDGKDVYEVKKYISEIKDKIIKGKIPIEDLVFRTNFDPYRTYVKEPKHVKAIQNAIKLGLIDGAIGEKVVYLYVADKELEVLGTPESQVQKLKQAVRRYGIDYKKNMERWFGKIEEILNSICTKQLNYVTDLLGLT